MVLRINTTDFQKVSVSLEKDGKTLKKLTGENKFGSQILLPLIIQLLKEQAASFSELESIEVATGPGSYTGLRVGAAVAIALGFALNIPVNGQKGQLPNLQYT